MHSYNPNITRVINSIRIYRNQYRQEKLLKHWIRSSKKNHSIRNPILVYQMGKVASTSIYESLKLLNIEVPIYHVHLLHPSTIRGQKNYIKNTFPEEIGRNIDIYFPVLQHNEILSKLIGKYLKKRKMFVISLMRDPIARNISTFFQALNRRVPNYAQKIKDQTMSVEMLISLFFEKVDHDFPLRWFDSDMKPVLGIDVFTQNFSKSKGYGIYKEGCVDLLLLKSESLSECIQKALEEFLGIKNFYLRDFFYASIFSNCILFTVE